MSGTWLMVCYIIIFGLFGVLQKISSNNLSWQTHLTFVWGSAFIFNSIFVFRNANFQWNKFIILSIILGFLASIGTICNYKALKLSVLSEVKIMENFTFIIPVLASFLFFNDPITIKKSIAIFLAILSIILMAI